MKEQMDEDDLGACASRFHSLAAVRHLSLSFCVRPVKETPHVHHTKRNAARASAGRLPLQHHFVWVLDVGQRMRETLAVLGPLGLSLSLFLYFYLFGPSGLTAVSSRQRIAD